MIRAIFALAGLLAVAVFASPAHAAFHLWDITEIYSNADGSVQFVELMDTSANEQFLSGQQFKTSAAPAHTFTFPANLTVPVGTTTAGKRMLIATPGFASLPGAVAPDYTFPSAHFFSTVADSLNFANVDIVAYTSGQLPTDGTHSIDRNKIQGINSPTNFAGQVGSLTVSLPGDLNSSGAVDRADAAILASNYGLSTATASLGDLTGDGIIGLADLAKLQASLSPGGSPSFSSPAAVPEPATWLSAVLGLITLAFVRRALAGHSVSPFAPRKGPMR